MLESHEGQTKGNVKEAREKEEVQGRRLVKNT